MNDALIVVAVFGLVAFFLMLFEKLFPDSDD